MASSTSTNSDQRGGLSRRQRAAARAARRMSDDDLLSAAFGDIHPHFKEHPLDGTMLGAIPQPQPVSDRPGPQPPATSANDPVAGTADWWKGSGQEGKASSTPAAAKPAAPKAPSLASAIASASDGLGIERAMGVEPLILTGLPGEDYEAALAAEYQQPPNTTAY